MESAKVRFSSIDEYISTFPQEVQVSLNQIRRAIQTAAPGAEEKISYDMPTFWLNGNLVYFAAFKHHIGFYTAPHGIEAFKEALSVYKGAKGSVQFPLDQPLPLELIGEIVRFRVSENMKKPSAKPAKKK